MIIVVTIVIATAATTRAFERRKFTLLLLNTASALTVAYVYFAINVYNLISWKLAEQSRQARTRLVDWMAVLALDR